MKNRQQGVALITAVLIVALVTTIAVAMASRQQLDIRRSANVFDGDQTWLVVLGGEDYARNVLVEDGKNSSDDTLDENWAQPVQFPFEQMMLSGQVEDMQGRFNLNNLVDADGKPTVDVQRFERLLKLFDLDTAIAQAVIDWLDKDIDSKPNGGAEDDYYMQLQPGYRAANRLMVSASELRLVNGVTAEAYEKLAPYIVALPGSTAININTASAAVLATVADNLTLADGESLLAARDKSGFGTIAAFTQQPALQTSNLDNNGLSVNSDYFLLNAMAEFDNSRSQQFSLLWRHNGIVKVIMRGQGAY
jgi:general secretion pathway protein K